MHYCEDDGKVILGCFEKCRNLKGLNHRKHCRVDGWNLCLIFVFIPTFCCIIIPEVCDSVVGNWDFLGETTLRSIF